jgi:cell division protein FtsL
MGLTFVMLALLLGCYSLCAMLVLFAAHVIRPLRAEPVDAADLPRDDALQQTGLQ